MNVEVVTDLIANNLEIAAPLAALLVSWLLYGVLGKRFLGADDDYWPRIRNRLPPLLDRLGAMSGLYAKHQQSQREFVGIVAMDEEAFEREGGTRVHLFAHDEPNSLNPLTAWRHYVGKAWSAKTGVRKMRDVLEEQEVLYTRP